MATSGLHWASRSTPAGNVAQECTNRNNNFYETAAPKAINLSANGERPRRGPSGHPAATALDATDRNIFDIKSPGRSTTGLVFA
jgi:hypothetical protein